MTIAIISHPIFALHETGPGHPERPDRVRVIQSALAGWSLLEATPATPEQLALAHDKDYIEWLFSVAPKDKLIGLDADTIMGPHSLEAALRAAGAVIQAVDLVMQGDASGVFL